MIIEIEELTWTLPLDKKKTKPFFILKIEVFIETEPQAEVTICNASRQIICQHSTPNDGEKALHNSYFALSSQYRMCNEI